MDRRLQALWRHARVELTYLRKSIWVLLACLIWQYVHGLCGQLAYTRHIPADRLRDLGFDLIPALGPGGFFISEARVTNVAPDVILVKWIGNPTRPKLSKTPSNSHTAGPPPSPASACSRLCPLAMVSPESTLLHRAAAHANALHSLPRHHVPKPLISRHFPPRPGAPLRPQRAARVGAPSKALVWLSHLRVRARIGQGANGTRLR